MDKDLQLPREFRGLWLPRKLLLAGDLSACEKLAVALIAGLGTGGCWASNAFLAAALGVSVGRLANVLTGLRKKGWVTVGTEPEMKPVGRRLLTVNLDAGGFPYSGKRVPKNGNRSSRIREAPCNIRDIKGYQTDNKGVSKDFF